MTSTTTWAVDRDTLLAKNGSTALGGGQDQHLPVGYWSGYRFRAAIKFTPNWGAATKVVSAKLRLRTTTQVHVGFGSDPDIVVQRITGGNFTENSAPSSEGGVWTSAASNFDDVAATSTGQATLDVSTSENTWVEVDITDIVEAWLPATIQKRSGAAGSALANYGILIGPVNDSDGTETTEFYSSESAYDPQIVFTFETNRAPNQPTCRTSGTVATVRPPFEVTVTDPDGDRIKAIDWRIATDSGFTAIANSGTYVGDWASGSNVTITPSVDLVRGTGYFYSARASDGTLLGAWSSAGTFTVNALPTVTLRVPASSGLAFVHNLGEAAVWTAAGAHAKPRFDWTTSEAQAAYRVRIYDAATGGALLHDSAKVVSAAVRYDAPLAIVNGTTSWWTIEVWDSLDESSGEAGRWPFIVRWGQAIYEHAPTGGASSRQWQFTSSPVAANTQAAFLFAPATGASGAGRGTWQASIGAVSPAAYLNACVRIASQVAGTNPALPDMTFTYVGSSITPDRWNLVPATDWTLDSDARRFGTQSIKCTVAADAGHRYLYPYRQTVGDDVPVTPNTTYTLSAFVKTNCALAHGTLGLRIYAGGGSPMRTSNVYVTNTTAYEGGWQRLTITYTTQAGETAIRPMVFYVHSDAVGGDVFWVDAFKLEEGTVATAWTPGFVADAVVLDSNGLAVDANAGGIFRLRGTAGSTRDILTLGAHGLVLGGDVELDSADHSGALNLGGRPWLIRPIPTRNNGAAQYSNDWRKVLSAAITAQYGDFDWLFWFTGNSGSVAASRALVSVRVKQQAAFGSQPSVYVDVLPFGPGNLSPDDVLVAVTSVAGPTTFEVWIAPPENYEAGKITTITYMNNSVVNLTLWDDTTPQAAVPSGTVTYGTTMALTGTIVPAPSAPVRRVYTAGGTWTKSAGLKYIEVECQGAGGGGGGTPSTVASQDSAGGGGGGGGYAKKMIAASDLAFLTGGQATVTVGVGGTASAGAAGNAGGASSVAFPGTSITTVQGSGGGGGNLGTATASTSTSAVAGGAGASYSGADFGATGSDGARGRVAAGAVMYANGGGALLGGSQMQAATGSGATGQNYGGGGTGATAPASTAARAGGAGGPGLVVITEYYG